MIDKPAPSPKRLPLLGLALIIGFLLAVLASNADFKCLPGQVPVPTGGKVKGIINTLSNALSHPGLFFPLVAGFFAIGMAVLCFPLLFKSPSNGRTTAVFGLIFLMIGGVGWGVYQLPRTPCDDDGWHGMLIMMQIGTATLVWFIVLLLTFRRDRHGR